MLVSSFPVWWFNVLCQAKNTLPGQLTKYGMGKYLHQLHFIALSLCSSSTCVAASSRPVKNDAHGAVASVLVFPTSYVLNGSGPKGRPRSTAAVSNAEKPQLPREASVSEALGRIQAPGPFSIRRRQFPQLEWDQCIPRRREDVLRALSHTAAGAGSGVAQLPPC